MALAWQNNSSLVAQTSSSHPLTCILIQGHLPLSEQVVIDAWHPNQDTLTHDRPVARVQKKQLHQVLKGGQVGGSLELNIMVLVHLDVCQIVGYHYFDHRQPFRGEFGQVT